MTEAEVLDRAVGRANQLDIGFELDDDVLDAADSTLRSRDRA